MQRMIEDYISRFYNKEAERSKRLQANDCALAKSIVDWKEHVAAAWDGIKVLEVRHSGELNSTITGEPFHVEVVVDTNGIGRDLGLEW